MSARLAMLAALAAAACGDHPAPSGASPWSRTMAPIDRRAWVAACAGSGDVTIVEGLDHVAYCARGTRAACALRWDLRRRRLASLAVSIVAADEEGVERTQVTRHAELIMAEMDERDREAAIAVRAVADGEPRELETRRFAIAGGKDLWPEGWGWRLEVAALATGRATAEAPPPEDATSWFALHTFRELPAASGLSVEAMSDDGLLTMIMFATPHGMPPHRSSQLLHDWETALAAGQSTRSIRTDDRILALSAGYTNAFRRADGRYQAQLQWRASSFDPDDDGRWRHRLARGGPIVFTTPGPVTLRARPWFAPPRRGDAR